MPRIIPAAFSSNIGASAVSYIWLMEWQLSGGTQYYSSNQVVSYNGNNYAPRIKSIESLSAPYIDANGRNFDEVTITLSNLADDSSANFPITALDATARFEDRVIRIHLLDVISGTAIEDLWWGYTKAPEYDGSSKQVKITASFPWDSLELPIPKVRLQRRCPYAFINETNTGTQSKGCPYTTFGTAGFSSCGKNPDDCNSRGMSRFFGGWREIGLFSGVESKRDLRKEALPVVLGVSNFKIRPLIYLSRLVDENFLVLNFIVSGTRDGLPFDASDLTIDNVRLFDIWTPAQIDFQVGGYPQTQPSNITLYPDSNRSGHSLVAHAAAVIPITSQIRDKLDNLESHDLKLKLGNGRKTALTGLPTENPVYQLIDILTDEVYGVGIPLSLFDATSYAAAASYASTRYQSRLELHESEPVSDFVQRMLRDFHGYITFESGKVHIKCKRNDESSVATFGTGGRKIHKDIVNVTEKDSTDLKNQAHITYRNKNRQEREVILYDKQAQRRAGNGVEKVEEEDWISIGLYRDEQVDINGAIYVREQQGLNLLINFQTALNDAVDLVCGDVIRVNAPDIPNNASNFLFRITKLTYPGPGGHLVTIDAQIYKATVYQDTADPLGTDILRTTNDTSGIGRPPDVTPLSLTRVDTDTNDTGGKLATLRATWTYPTVDQAAQQAEGIFAPYPIIEVALFVRYTDESFNEARLAKTVKYPTATADIEVDFHKNKSVEVFFVAIGHNHARAPLGYQADPSKASVLTADLSATAFSAAVENASQMNVNDFLRCENEFVKLTAKAGNTLTFANNGANRTPQFDSSAIAHPRGTQISVAKPSYPSLILALSQPRFTYKRVTGVSALQRSDGVLVKFDDVSAENHEEYLIFVSIDSDANTNAAKLGVPNPIWYTTDPLTPPASVKLYRTKALRHRIPQEDLGGANVTAWIRVAARNGKHNFSDQLSTLVSNSSNGRSVKPTSPPPDPALADIIENQRTNETSKRRVTVRLRVWADPTKTKTFDQVGSERVGIFLLKTEDPDNTKPRKYTADVKDLNSTSEIVSVELDIGQGYKWLQSFNANGNGKTLSNEVTTVSFVAGDYSYDPNDLAVFTITLQAIDSKHSLVRVTMTQPSTGKPVLVKRGLLEVQLPLGSPNPPYDGVYREVAHPNFLNDIGFSTLGATKVYEKKIKHPRGVNGINVRFTVKTFGDLTRQVSTTFNASADALGDPGTPSQPSLSISYKGARGLICRAKKQAGGVNWNSVFRVGYAFYFLRLGSRIFFNPDTGAEIGAAGVATFGFSGNAEFFDDVAPGEASSRFHGHVKKSELPTEAKAGFFVICRAYNRVFGVIASSISDASFPSLSTLDPGSASFGVVPADPADDDDASPNTLPTPRFKFKPRGLIGSFDLNQVANNRQILYIEWHIDDGTNSLNIDDPDSFIAVSGTGAWYVRGREASITIPISARQLQKVFGPGKTVRLKYRITNSKGTTESPLSAGLAIDTLGDFNDKKSFVPLIKNGTFANDRSGDGGSSNQLRNWEKCDTSHNRPGSGGSIIDTSSTNIEWDRSGRRVRFEENVPTRYLFYDLGKILIPGQFLSVYFIAQVDSGTPTPTFKLRLMADVDTDSDGIGDIRVADHNAEVIFNTLQLSTSYKEVGMSIKLKDDAFNNQGLNTTVGHWLVLEVSGGGSSVVRISDFSVLDGLTPAPALRAVKFEKDNFDITTTVTQGGTGTAIPPSGEYPGPEGAAQL